MKRRLLSAAAAAVFAVTIFSGCAESTEIPAGTVSETTESFSAGLDTTAAAETTSTSETTFKAETEVTEEPSHEDVPYTSDADKELLKILTDETGLSEDVLLEYARKTDNFEDMQRRYATEGIYDFNGDGVPEIYVGGWDMITPYAAVYDISGDNPEFMFSMTTTTIDSTTLFDGIIYLYYDRKENQYFYYTMTYWWSDDGFGDTIMYFIDKSRVDVDLENHILGEEQHSQESFSDEDEWKAAYEEAKKEFYNYGLIDKIYTLDEPYLYEGDGSCSLRLLHSYYRSNSRRRLAMLLNETGVSGLTFNMSPDEVKKLIGEPNRAFDDSIIFKAETWVCGNGNLTFTDKAEDGNYRLASMWRLNSFDFCGITENTSRSELISALKAMGIYPEPNYNFNPESETLENAEQITAGNPKGLNIKFKMDGNRIEYMSAQLVGLT